MLLSKPFSDLEGDQCIVLVVVIDFVFVTVKFRSVLVNREEVVDLVLTNVSVPTLKFFELAWAIFLFFHQGRDALLFHKYPL